MQIQSLQSTAAIAAAAAAQVSSKGHSTSTPASGAEASALLAIERVGKSEQAGADRDAQGGGEGLGHRPASGNAKETQASAHAESLVDGELAAILPGPSSQLDLLG